jgi:hypothetical protein
MHIERKERKGKERKGKDMHIAHCTYPENRLQEDTVCPLLIVFLKQGRTRGETTHARDHEEETGLKFVMMGWPPRGLLKPP